MKDETYCPCCSSDDTEFLHTEHSDNTMGETFKCNYCNSIFENEYKLLKQNTLQDNSKEMYMLKAKEMYMLKAKEVIETELEALGDNITNSRGFADGKVYFLLACLKDHLNDLDTSDLVKLYESSTFRDEYEETK